MIVTFARKELQDDLMRRDHDGTFSRELWQRCAEFGVQGLPFPSEYGGGDQDIITTVYAMEALGYGCRDGGLLFGVNAQLWSVQMPIFRFGSEDQKRRYLTRINTGEWIGAHGMSEPDSGSDAFSLRTTAELRGDHYLLNGTKTFVSNGPVADLFLVFASIERSKGVLAITGFLVERDSPGIRLGRNIEKLGLTTSPMSELILDDCAVPVENRLGREGRGAQVFNDSMEWERACIMAPCLGAMQRQLEQCTHHARLREQFGKPIGEFQSVSNRLASMKVRLDAGRLLTYRAAWAKQEGHAAGPAASIAKLFLSEAYIQSCLDAVQIHGGYGFTREYEIERDLRDSIGGTLYSGTSEVQKAIIARSLGL